jgi:PhnB protein
MSPVTPIPEGHHTVTPHLVVRDAARLIDFYKRAFGATELFRHAMPDGKIMHAELRIGDSIVYLADEFPPHSKSPEALGGTPVTLHLYVENVDALWDRAVAAGAKIVMPLSDQFWGDRYGQLADPAGHRWSLATRKEVVAPEEIEKRARAAMASSGGG